MLTTVDKLVAGQKFHLPGVPEQVWQLIRMPERFAPERQSDIAYITVTNPTAPHVPTFCGYRDPESAYGVVVVE